MNWQRMQTAPRDGTTVLLFTNVGIIEGWYCPIQPKFASYESTCYDDADGGCWVCMDSEYEIFVEEIHDKTTNTVHYCDHPVLAWMPSRLGVPDFVVQPPGGAYILKEDQDEF